jgi:hypothetical protein
VAQVFLEREILDGQQLHDYLDRVNIPPLLATWLQTGEMAIEQTAAESICAIGNGFNQKHLYQNLC